MKGIRNFVQTTVIGGLVVVLPIGIVIFVFNWIMDFLLDGVAPLVAAVAGEEARNDVLAGLLALAILLFGCFLIGLLVRTRLGKWLYAGVENRVLRRAPGYSMVKETLLQFTGKKANPFSSVALVDVYGNQTLVSAFITDRHEDGRCTVFVPTGPNPTSGNIFHVTAEQVFPVDASVEDTMRSIISCGAGSASLLGGLKNKKEEGKAEG